MTPADINSETTILALRDRLQELEAERDAYAAMLLGSEQERASLRSSLDEQTFLLDECRARLDEYQVVLVEQEAVMAAVWGGLSWRVTAPLRGITGLLKGGS